MRKLAPAGDEPEELRPVELELDARHGVSTTIDLAHNRRGIAAKRGRGHRRRVLISVLADVVSRVVGELNNAIQSAVERLDGPGFGVIDAGPPEINHGITVDAVDFTWDGDSITLTLTGNVQGDFSCQVSQHDESGSERLELQGDGLLNVTFEVGGYFLIPSDGDIEITGIKLDTAGIDAWIE